MRSQSRRVLGLALSGLFVVSACSGTAATPAPTAAPSATPAGSTAPSEAPSTGPTEMPGTKEFKIAFTSPGLSTSPFLAAIDDLNKNGGYKIEYTVLDASELLAEGVASGEFAFASGANNGILKAVSKGANIKAITARVNNEWTLYARKDITSCAGLAGKRVAIHSQGAVSTAMVKNYIAANCPGTEPEYVVIEGSPNRVAAMLADQIDASPLELSDSLTIDTQAGDRFAMLTSFVTDLPDLQTTSVYVNGNFARENPGTVVALIKALLAQHTKIDGNPAYLKQIAETYVKDAINAETIDAATQKYVELKMFPTDGGITNEKMQYTAEFFGPDGTGATENVVPLVQWVDLTFLEMALAQ